MTGWRDSFKVPLSTDQGSFSLFAYASVQATRVSGVLNSAPTCQWRRATEAEHLHDNLLVGEDVAPLDLGTLQILERARKEACT